MFTEYVLKEQQCIHYKQIEHCKSANNSQCQKCSTMYNLNNNKNECRLQIGWIIGLPLLSAVIIIISIIIVLIIILKQIGKHQDYQELSNLQILKISKLNTELYKLSDTVITNKQILDFNDDYDEIPVNKESNTFIIIGNKSKRRQKIQITSKHENTKYEIFTDPEIISLNKGEACEFKVTINPLCSFEVIDQLIIVSVDIKKGVKETIPLQIKIKT